MQASELQPEPTPDQQLAKQQAMVGTVILTIVLVAAFCVGFFFGWRTGVAEGRELFRRTNRFDELRD